MSGDAHARRARLLGIRARTTLVAVAVVGVSVALAMVAVVLVARANLAGQIAANAEARAQDVALLVKAGTVPSPIPGRGETLLVQVVDVRGKVLASSASIEGQAPLVDARSRPGTLRTVTVSRLNDSDDTGSATHEGGADESTPFLVALAGARSPAGPVTVVVAASLGPIEELTNVLMPPLATGLPVIVLVVAVTVWALTGRALRPVEAIRAEAEAISASALDRRVPVPPARDEIGRLAETMNRMLARIESSAVRQRRFVADASHELKSPVAAMRTMLDVARLNPAGVDLSALLDDLTVEDVRLERLTADLLALARFDEGEMRLHAVEVDLDDIILTEVAAVRLTADATVDLSGVTPARLEADPEALGRLLRNLLENAARFARGQVWVASQTDGENAVLTVSDDGPGIPGEDRERVFERFVRLDEARGRADGSTGLGLAVCRAIAQVHGGEIRAVEPEHGGATIKVHLPLRQTF